MKYLYPLFDGVDLFLFRVGGPGLGNLLFPWSRAVVLSHLYDIPMIAPTWPQIKLGPLLRGELDSRMYINMFESLDLELHGAKRLRLLLNAVRYKEMDLDKFLSSESKSSILVTAGMIGYLDPVYEYRSLLLNRLLAYKGASPSANEPESFIAVHVRLGDFSEPYSDGNSNNMITNTRLPLGWYKKQMQQLATILPGVKFYIFTDGTDSEISTLLEIDNTKRNYGGDALDDLLLMANSKIMICSNSTFSLWAAFLSGNDSIWYPGTLTSKFQSIPSRFREAS